MTPGSALCGGCRIIRSRRNQFKFQQHKKVSQLPNKLNQLTSAGKKFFEYTDTLIFCAALDK